jgi:hypothetical protein
MTRPSDPITALPYATPSTAGSSPVAAGVWVMLGGLALIFFGGCFCIGILLTVNGAFYGGLNPSQAQMTVPQVAVMLTLYACAFACFASGGYVLFLGLRKLLAVGR